MNRIARVIVMSLTLAVSMTVLGSVPVQATNTNDFGEQISATYNSEITSGILKKGSEAAMLSEDRSRPQNITLYLEENEQGNYTASGQVTIVSGTFEYTVSGELLKEETSDGEGLIGYMSGALDDGTYFGLNLHYIPSAQKIFIYSSVGYVTEENYCETYIFGDVFDEMNTLVNAYSDMANETFGSDEQSSNLVENNVIPLAAADYNTTYRGIGIGRGKLINGKLVDLIATTIYTPKRMAPNQSFSGCIKVNGHTGNARTYVQGTKLVPGALSTWVTSGTCSISSPKNNMMEMSRMDPGNDSWSVSIPIPYFIGGKWGLLPWSLNIGFNTIKANLTKNSGSWLDNTAEWKHNYSENINWGSNGAVESKTGYAGRCTMIYQDNKDYPVTVSITGKGSLNYSYRSVYGTTSYTGNFSAYSSISVDIRVDARKS